VTDTRLAHKGRSSRDATAVLECGMTFYEVIDNLIDVTGVPETKRSGIEYEAARNLIHIELSSMEEVEVACYHEAGHWAFAILVANQLAVDGSLFEVVGPRIKYDVSKKNPYDATPTGLSLPGMENWKAQDEDDVGAMARIAVAGGESVHHFFGPTQKRGDKNDKDRFEEFCKNARMRLGGVVEPPHVYWGQAIKDAQIDFKDTLFALRISAKAELVKHQQFGPVFRSHMKATL
jgi:hypothetical protein